MSKYKEELDYIYQHRNNQNQALLEKRVINVLLKEFCDCISIKKKATANDLARVIMSLNNVLNKHNLCTTNVVPKDNFLEYMLYKAEFLECEELKEQLKTEKGRRNLLEAKDNYGWAEDYEVSESEFIQ